MKKIIKSLIKDILSNKPAYFLFLLILIIGIFLRFFQLEERFVFDWDQERDAFAVKEILSGNLTLLGPKVGQGSNFFLGPFYYYFLVPFYWFSRGDPIGAAIAASSVGVLTVISLFLASRYIFNIWVGLTSAFLWTFSFFIISGDRLAWNVNLFPIFSLLFLYALFKICAKQDKFYLLLGLTFGILIQLHFSSIFFIPIFLIFFLVFRPRLKSKYLFFGILIFLLLNLPLVLFELRHQFLNTKLIVSFFANPPNPQQITFSSNVERVFTIFTRNFVLPFYQFLDPSLRPFLLWLFLFSIAILSFIIKKVRKKIIFLVVWMIIPVISYLFYRGHTIPEYYFVISTPIIFILVSYLLVFIYQRHTLLKALIIVLLFSFALSNFDIFWRFQDKLSLTYKREAIKFVFKHVGNRPLFLSYSTKINYDSGYRYLLSLYGKESQDIPEVYHYSIVVPVDFDKGEREWIFGGIKVIQRSLD